MPRCDGDDMLLETAAVLLFHAGLFEQRANPCVRYEPHTRDRSASLTCNEKTNNAINIYYSDDTCRVCKQHRNVEGRASSPVNDNELQMQEWAVWRGKIFPSFQSLLSG